MAQGKGVSDASRYYEAWRWLGQQPRSRVRFFAANAETQAESDRMALGWDKWKLPGYTAWITSAPGIREQALAMGGGASAGGGSSGSSGTGAGGTALAATQQGAAYTGGGQYFSIGAVENAAAGLQQRDDEFVGIDTFTPDEKLAPGRSPNAINWDGLRKIGSRCVRSGMAKLDDDRDNLAGNYFTITCVANSSLAASTDYITFTKPDTTTHAYWFDTTGSDTEPAGSSGATASTEVTTTGMTAAQVATALAAAINTDAIGLSAIAESSTVRVFNQFGAIGTSWTLAESVTDAGFTVATTTPTSLDDDYRGLCIGFLPGSGSNTHRLIMGFADAAIGGTASQWPTQLMLTSSTLEWGRPANLSGWPGPKLALSDQTGRVLRVTTDYTNVFSSANDGLRNASVKRLIVRYSSIGYPLDKDGLDNTQSTALVDGAWAGASRADDTSALTAARYYVSAWAVSIEGVSERSEASLTLA